MRFCRHIISVCLVVCALHGTAFAYDDTMSLNAKPFGVWLGEFRTEAANKGIRPETLDKAFAGIELDPRVIKLDRKQPDSTMSFTTYKNNTLPASRIAQAKRLYQQHKTALESAASLYGVPAPYIVALWGKESSFGNYMGSFSIIRSLTTLAYDGRRAELFRNELLEALFILQETGMPAESLIGSWAGAMGQCQFMPSTFRKYAVDANGDGKRDIWYTEADAFASIANYLKSIGWKTDEKWGRKVRTPNGFDHAKYENIKAFRPLSEWKSLGITAEDGSALPDTDIDAALIYAGRTTPNDGIYLIYPNYNVLLTWNYSRYFATAVGLFADQLP